MAILFPNTPAINQEYTYGATIWYWDGQAWLKKKPSTTQNLSVAISKIVTSNTSISSIDTNTLIGVNTLVSPVIITLPTTPATNFYFELVDTNGTWDTNPVTISGGKIQGQNQNLLLDVASVKVGFCYTDATTGWVITNTIGVPVGNTVSTKFTGIPTINTLPAVSYNAVTNTFLAGTQNISKMSSPGSITYDTQGRVITYDTDGMVYTLAYTIGGLLKSVTNGLETNTILYDSNNRVVGVTLI